MSAANVIAAPTVNGAPLSDDLRLAYDDEPIDALDDVDAPPSPPEFNPDLVDDLLRDLILGAEHPMHFAQMAGIRLRDYARIAADEPNQKSVRELAELMEVHVFAVTAGLKASAAYHLQNMFCSSRERIASPRSAKIKIDLCLEAMKLALPKLEFLRHGVADAPTASADCEPGTES